MLTNRTTLRNTAAALAVVMSLSACATQRDTTTMTPAEKRLYEQSQDFNQTMVEGAVAGVLVGALLGAAIGGKRGAAIGAGAGLAAGLGAGYMVAKQKENYATEEARLDSMVGDVKADNAKLQQLTASAREVIAQDRDRISHVQRELAAGHMKADEANRRLAAVDQNVAHLQKTIDNLKKKVKEYREASNQTRAEKRMNTSSMDAEIAQLEGQVSNLETELNQLVARRSVTRVG